MTTNDAPPRGDSGCREESERSPEVNNVMTTVQVEEAIAWNSYRATTEAIQKAEEIATEFGTGELMVEVLINIVSDAFPGEYDSGRSRSRRAGHALCIYRSKEHNHD